MVARIACLGLITFSLLGCSDDSEEQSAGDEPVTFQVTIENISGDAMPPSPIAPGVWVLHEGGQPIFTEGQADRGEGLERLAEDGAADILFVGLGEDYEVGPFDPDKDSYATDSAMPGDQFQFLITAAPGQSLSLAAMLAASNDTFVGLADSGVALFDGADPVSGEIEAMLWNTGTEVDQPLGEGADQPMRQADFNTGEDENGVVSPSDLDPADYVRITLEPQ